RIEEYASRVSQALNTKFGGVYVFGGGRDDAPPFAPKALEDFAGVAPTADLFSDGDIRALVKISDAAPLEVGVTASELGFGLADSINRLKDFADGLGGNFSDPLTAAERTFLTTEIANITAVFNDITAVEGRN